MRVMQCLLTAAAASSMLACDRELTTPSSPNSTSALATGFVTSQPAQARSLLPQARLKPIITVGDPIPGATDADAEQRVWAPIPDGLGAYQDGNDLVLFANHEITGGGVDGRFKNARVSRLVLDPATLSVKSGSYAITGKQMASSSSGFARSPSTAQPRVLGDGSSPVRSRLPRPVGVCSWRSVRPEP